MLITEQLRDIYSAVKHSPVAFVHCFGLPGSGKTELMRYLEDCFAREEDRVVVWDIDIRERNLTEGLRSLVVTLVKKDYITEDQGQLILSNLESKSANELVDVLSQSSASVLIVIRHLEKNDNLLRDFVRSLKDKSTVETLSRKFHLYMTSRNISPLFSESENQSLTQKENFAYLKKQVHGFNEEETVRYMLNDRNDNQTERQAVTVIFEKFSGLPLSMQVTRSYCSTYNLSYEKYLKELKAFDLEMLLKNEKELLTRQYEGIHPFYSIIYPFVFENKSNEDPSPHWNYLACLSHLCNREIPEIIWKPFYTLCYNLDANSERAEKTAIHLIDSLIKLSSCTKKSNGDVCIENIVATAFFITRKEYARKNKQSFNSLGTAIKFMIQIVSSQKSTSQLILRKFYKHLVCLQDQSKTDDSISKDEKNNLEKWVQLCSP